jgi:hypothetical protein
MILRSNTLTSKLVKVYFARHGAQFLKDHVAPFVSQIISSSTQLEVPPHIHLRRR